MDASRKIQRSIHDVKLIVQFITVSRKLGTYHFEREAGIFIALWARLWYNQVNIKQRGHFNESWRIRRCAFLRRL